MKKIVKIIWFMVCMVLIMMPTGALAHDHHHHEAPLLKPKPRMKTDEKSDLQKLIDATEPGGTLVLEGRTYRGSVVISKPITIQGDEDTKIVSLGTPIMISDAENVVLKDLDIEADEVAIIGENVKSLQLKNLQVEQGMGGIQLTDSADIILENVDISGQDGHFSEKGHAVAIYKSKNIQASDCDIWGVLDGFYLERVDGITLSNNRIEEGRYAVHVMYSDNVELIANKATANMTGLMIMIANNVTVHNNQISKNNTLNSLGVYMYDNENIDFQQNILSENTVAMSVEHTRNMDMSNNEFWTNGTAVQVKQSPELQVTKNQFYGNILTMRTDQAGVQLSHNFYDDYSGRDYDGDGIGDTTHITTNSFGQWMVRKPVYQYFIESPSVVTLNLMDTEVVDEDSAIQIDESPVVMEKRTNLSLSLNGWQFGGSLVVLLAILYVRRKLT